MSSPKGTLRYPRTEPVLSATAYRTIWQRIDEYAISFQQLSRDIDQINFACRFIRSKQFPSILYFQLEDAVITEPSDWNYLWKLTTRISVREYSISQLVPSRDAKDALVQALMSPDSRPCAFSSKNARVLGLKEFYYFFVIIDDFLPELLSAFLSPSPSQKSKKRAQDIDEKKIFNDSVPSSNEQKDVPEQLLSECPICLDKFTSQVLPCGHSYCESCLETWCCQEHNCPMCRISVKSSDVRESWQICEGMIEKGKIQQEYLANLQAFPYSYVNLFPER